MTNTSRFIYSDEEGEYLVRLARKSLTYYLQNGSKLPVPEDAPEKLSQKSGVFVTLRVFSNKPRMDLRGCIGRPSPKQMLLKGTIDAAIDSGLNDWRFNEVTLSELDNIVFEVTALTPPELITGDKPQKILDSIELGKDGLIIAMRNAPEDQGGLFLPQVPIEWNMSKKQYLMELCGKAGLSSNMWKETQRTDLWKFQGEIFTEKEPNGDVERIIL